MFSLVTTINPKAKFIVRIVAILLLHVLQK